MTYRTGRTVPNTLYDGDVFIGSATTGHKAHCLVEAANGNEHALAAARYLIEGWDEFSVLNQGDYEGLAALVNVVDERIESLRAALGDDE